MAKDDVPVDAAAAELGVPADALRLYVAAHRLADPAAATISRAQVAKLTDELRARAGALRLDDLAKTALTIEWLAEAAIAAAHESTGVARAVEEIRGSAPDLKGLETRVGRLEARPSGDGAEAAKLAGSLQGMLESQGRELDGLRAQLAGLEVVLASLDARLEALRGALRAAVVDDPVVLSPGPGPGPGAAQPPKREPAQSPPEPKRADPKYVNTPVTTPVKLGIKREIEYNFLLERMGFRRLDSYADAEADKVAFPTDDAIRAFLATYELGCPADEVEMVSVQRGEYQMVQYQRVDKASGLRNWVSPKRR